MQKKSFLLVYLSIFFTSISFADFTYLNIGARPISLGAFTGLADDPNAVFYNPAGLSTLNKLEITSTYGLLLYGLKGSEYFNQQLNKNLEPGLNESVLGMALPIEEIGTAGIGWYNLSLGEFYSEYIFDLSFGRKVIEKLHTGITLKILNKQFGRDIYTEQYELFKTKGYSKTNFSFDLGGIYEFSNKWQIGLLIKDIPQPNMSLSGASEDTLPLQLRLGIAAKKDSHRIVA
ncbi:MAG: hypothetical protein QME68_07310, partial [Elusimicrobiota bacterium]|nr:hypothetical protein [Elusimicrobiota bacterium]